jgi:hypothetical protein
LTLFLQWACQGPKGLNKDKVVDNTNNFNRGGRIFLEFRQRPNDLVKVLTAGKKQANIVSINGKTIGIFYFPTRENP